MCDQVYNFLWIINDYHLSNQRTGECYRSPSFYVDYLEGTTWFIEVLYHKDKGREMFSSYLCRQSVDDGPKNIQVHAKILIFGKFSVRNDGIFTCRKGSKHGWSKLVERNNAFRFRADLNYGHELLPQPFRDIRFSDNELVVLYQLHRFCPFEPVSLDEENRKLEKKWGDILVLNHVYPKLNKTNILPVSLVLRKFSDPNAKYAFVDEPNAVPNKCTWMLFNRYMKDLKLLSNSFKSLLQSGHYADLILCTKDAEYKVHKVMIEARFPKLATELHLHEREKGTMKRKFPIISNMAMKALLNYIYCGILDISPLGVLENLHKVSQSFGLTDFECHLYSPVDFCQASTEMNIETLNFFWHIKNISLWSTNTNPYVRVINSYELEDYKLLISISLTDETTECNTTINKIKIMFQLLDFDGRKNKTICGNIKIVSCAANFLTPFEFHIKFESSSPYNIFYPLTKQDLLKRKLLQNDTLVLNVSIDLCDGVKKSSIISQTFSSKYSFKREYFGKLSEDMLHLYIKKKFCDFSLISADEDIFDVHKAILAARSNVFAKMFIRVSPERNFIFINFRSEILEMFLHYIYSGYSGMLKKLDEENIKDLLMCASYFNVEDLVEKCYTYLELKARHKSHRTRHYSGGSVPDKT